MRPNFFSVLALVVFLTTVFLTGCNRSPTSPDPVPMPTINAVHIVEVTPEENSIISSECFVNPFTFNPVCPTIVVEGTLDSSLIPDLGYVLMACFSMLPDLITGSCSGASMTRHKVSPKKFIPITPEKGVRYVIAFILDDHARKGLEPYRRPGGFIIPPDALGTPEIKSHVLYSPLM